MRRILHVARREELLLLGQRSLQNENAAVPTKAESRMQANCLRSDGVLTGHYKNSDESCALRESGMGGA